MHHALRCFVLVFLAISVLPAQKSGTSAGSTGIGTTGTSGNIGGNTNVGSLPTQQPSQPTNPGQTPESQMPVFLSGKVIMDDGTPPATSIAIQRVCSGSPRTVAFTNAKGQFSFQWGSTAGIVADASEEGGPAGIRVPGQSAGGRGGRGGSQLGDGSLGGTMGSPMFGCDLVANAPGFRSDRLNLSDHRATDNPELGSIVLHRIAGVEGTSVSATALNAPKDAKKAWEKGADLLHKSKNADAEKELEKAVAIYPKYANAWLDLGRARVQRQEAGPARDAFLKAVDADDKLVDPYMELGEMAVGQQNWPDAAKYLDRALQLDPVDYPALWFEDAIADYNTQNLDRAEKNAREALKLAPPNFDPRANELLGLVLLQKRDYAGAGDALRAYVKLVPSAKDLDQIKEQIGLIDSQLAVTKP